MEVWDFTPPMEDGEEEGREANVSSMSGQHHPGDHDMMDIEPEAEDKNTMLEASGTSGDEESEKMTG